MFPRRNVALVCNSFCWQNLFAKSIIVFCCITAMVLPSCKDNDAVVSPTPEVKKEKEVAITSITPSTARAGDTLIIQGRYFSEVTTSNVVVFVPDLQGIVLSSSTTEIVVVVPVGAQSGKVKVRVGEQTAEAPQVMEVLVREVYITSFEPDTIAAHEILTINGDGFSSVYAENVVMIGDVKAILYYVSPTQIRCKIPEGCTTGHITVKVLGGQGTSSKSVYVLQELLPKKNCVIEISGIRVLQQTRLTRANSDGSYQEVDSSTAWQDFTFALDTRKQLNLADVGMNWLEWQYWKGFRRNIYIYTFQNPFQNPFSNVPSSYTLMVDIDTIDYSIRAFQVQYTEEETSSLGKERRGSSKTTAIVVGSIRKPWNKEHEYDVSAESFRNAVKNVVWSSSSYSWHSMYGSSSYSVSVKEFMVTDSAKISIKFVD